MSVVVPQAYAWNLLAASSIAFHVIIVGGMYVGAARKKYGIKYPDMGNGRYAKKLTDAQWVDFNNHQRVHQNYVEGVTAAVVLELVSGLFFPTAAAILGAVYIVGRQVYCMGYSRRGAEGRLAGAVIFDVALVGWFGMAVYGCLSQLGFF